MWAARSLYKPVLDGQCRRHADPIKHLGPPAAMGIPPYSPAFETRCGLENDTGAWVYTNDTDDENVWCADCLSLGGIPFIPIEIGGR